MGRRFSIRKLLLDLLVIVCLVVAGWTGYQLFVLHRLDPVMGSIIFVIDIGVLIWNVAMLRNHYYKGKHPSFKMVFLLLLVVVLIFGFAGIEPLSSYKDNIVDKISPYINQITSEFENINVDDNTDIIYSGQDVEYEIIGFKRLIFTGTGEVIEDAIRLSIKCKPTDKTSMHHLYNIQVIGGSKILNMQQYIEEGFMSPKLITIDVEGLVIEEMLLDAEQRYEDTKSEAEEIVEKQNYNFFMKGEVPSYEEYKRQEEKLEKLNNEMKKWDAYSNGEPYGDESYNLHDFCSEYITIAFTRY